MERLFNLHHVQEIKKFLAIENVVKSLKDFWDIVGPGGKLHPTYFIEHKGHIVIEGLLIAVIFILFVQRSFKPKAREEEPLTEKEVEQLCKEWKPEPLVPNYSDDLVSPESLIIQSVSGTHVTIDNRDVLSFICSSFLGVATDAEVVEKCSQTIEKYGVGSCGPRGFYGTIDVHLELEKKLASFFGTEDAIIFAYDIATPASIIPCLVNMLDVVVVDEHVSFPIQQGIALSKAKMVKFKHNDMADLERALKQVEQEERKARKPLTRRFIIVEAVYANYGDLAKLDEIFQLKEKYSWRLMVEESYSVGVLGATGRGVCEHWGLAPDLVDVRCASMGNAFGTIGGFCVGSTDIVDHQRLSGQAYVFSASLPPFLATAAIAAMERMEGKEGESNIQQLAKICRLLHSELSNVPGMQLYSGPDSTRSAIMHLQLSKPPTNKPSTELLLQRLVDEVLQQDGILVAVHRTSNLDRLPCPCSLKVMATVQHTEKDVKALGAALKRAAKKVLGGK